MQRSTMTLDDFRTAIRQIRALSEQSGGLRALLGRLPGVAHGINEDLVRLGESELFHFEVAIDSMTFEERADSDLLLDGPRRSRVAHGAGLTLSTVEALLSRFYLARQAIRKLPPH